MLTTASGLSRRAFLARSGAFVLGASLPVRALAELGSRSCRTVTIAGGDDHVGPLGMTADSRPTALTRPASVAIHDDGDVARHVIAFDADGQLWIKRFEIHIAGIISQDSRLRDGRIDSPTLRILRRVG